MSDYIPGCDVVTNSSSEQNLLYNMGKLGNNFVECRKHYVFYQCFLQKHSETFWSGNSVSKYLSKCYRGEKHCFSIRHVYFKKCFNICASINNTLYKIHTS